MVDESMLSMPSLLLALPIQLESQLRTASHNNFSHLEHLGTDQRWAGNNRNASLLQGSNLIRSSTYPAHTSSDHILKYIIILLTLAASNDSTSMSHASSWRCSTAGDEADNRLGLG